MKKAKATTQAKPRSGLIGALDIGTTKVTCLIGRAGGPQGVRVVGIGHHVSEGVRNGTLVDLDAAEASIRACVDAAERMAEEKIRHVVVNVSAGAPRSRLYPYEISVAGHQIGDADIRRILDPAAFAEQVADDHQVIHAIPVGYSIDGCRGVRDPRGMFGNRLGVNVNIISASAGALRNLYTCVSRCHLEIGSKVVSPYASALGCLIEDEKQLGVTLIDMGGGTTSVAVYFDAELVFTDTLPVGGQHVTRDLARGLSTPVSQAERIKTLYGSCLPSPSDIRQIVEVPPIGADADCAQVPRSMLVTIIRPRIEETFEMVRSRLHDAGFDKVAGRRLVITGGACQLPGAVDLAGAILDKQVRIGRPTPLDGLPEAGANPGFATCAGLLRFAMSEAEDTTQVTYCPAPTPPGRFGRFGQWLRENF